jgi:hypothetical protein
MFMAARVRDRPWHHDFLGTPQRMSHSGWHGEVGRARLTIRRDWGRTRTDSGADTDPDRRAAPYAANAPRSRSLPSDQRIVALGKGRRTNVGWCWG